MSNNNENQDSEPIVSLRGLTIGFDHKNPLVKVPDLTIFPGEIVAITGASGVGKTTFLNILGGIVTKTNGKVRVWGFDLDKNPRQVRASIGIVPQEVNLDAFFSPRDLLELQAGLYGVKKKSQ